MYGMREPMIPLTRTRVSWKEINQQIDEILDTSKTPKSRRYTFSGGPVGKVTEETYEVLPNGARRIIINWGEMNEVLKNE